VKMPNPSRIQARSWWICPATIGSVSGALTAAATAGFTSSRNYKARSIQKAPKVPKPVAPMTFLLRNSHMAASSWAIPPYASA